MNSGEIMLKPYIIITSKIERLEDVDDFEDVVNDAMSSDGYECTGGVCVITDKDGSVLMYQALIRNS